MSTVQKSSKPHSSAASKKAESKASAEKSTAPKPASSKSKSPSPAAKDSYQKAAPTASAPKKPLPTKIKANPELAKKANQAELASVSSASRQATLSAPVSPRQALALAAPTTPMPLAASKLPSQDQKALQEIQSGAKGPEAKENMERLTGSRAYQNLAETNQVRALECLLANPTSKEASKNLQNIIESPNFSKILPKSQGQTLEVFKNTTLQGQKELGTLLVRQVGSPPQSALVDMDRDGKTLVSHLQAMATGPMATELEKNGIKKDALLETTIQEMAKPGQINQDNHNTCTVTSMQYMLCTKNPAEFARIMSGLASPEGKATLRNGDTLNRLPDSMAFDKSTNRSASERLFQASMMDYCNRQDVYSNPTDMHTVADNTTYGGGLKLDQVDRGINALFGKQMDMVKTAGKPQAMVDLLTKESGKQMLIGMKWGGGGHAVVAEKIENGRVYFRNPYGPKNDANGTEYSNPARRLEDNTSGLESMSVEEFKKHILVAYPPK